MDHPRSRPQLVLTTFAAAALVACAVLACSAPASAATARRAHARARHHVAAPAATARPAANTAGAQGMVVGIDPETGRLGMPSADQMLQLSPSEKTGLLRTDAGLSPVRLPDGTMMIDLQGRFLDYSVLRIDANGRPRVGCVDDAGALSRWFGAGTPLPTPVLEVK